MNTYILVKCLICCDTIVNVEISPKFRNEHRVLNKNMKSRGIQCAYAEFIYMLHCLAYDYFEKVQHQSKQTGIYIYI